MNQKSDICCGFLLIHKYILHVTQSALMSSLYFILSRFFSGIVVPQLVPEDKTVVFIQKDE